MKISKLSLVIIFSIIFMIGSVIFFNYVVKKDKERKENKNEVKETQKVDLSDASNVPTIDAKLGDDIVITQEYLMRYVTKKKSIWYQSSGYVQNISKKNGTTTITISDTLKGKENINLLIDSDKCSVKKGEFVYFVGTIELGTSNINLAKISNQEFSYSNATKILVSELIKNIKLLNNNIFVISGFLVTDNNNYKLYESKESYTNDDRYFLIKWKNTFNYTGNQKVYLTCKIDKDYSLKDCLLNE